MKVKITKVFRNKLNSQVEFIAQDKPGAARKFKNDLITRIKEIAAMPYRNRKSVFFDQEEIRDLVYKGYLIVYKVDESTREIIVFGFVKYEENLH